ncbi:ABC transporter ATP-binding protein [Actinomycetota bacterium]|nr:ABC transporter ATP-binding protein [Actinomycetota bacterium]
MRVRHGGRVAAGASGIVPGTDSAPGGWGVERLRLTLGGTAVLDDVSLDLPAGEVTAVVGGDGAGKSTLVGVVVGTRVPDAGRVRVPARESIGLMPATSGVWRDLSVAENVELVAQSYRLDPTTARVRTERLLGAADLLDVRHRLGRELSGGMRQKLGFCLAMLHEPALVVLDEPSTGVDPVSRVQLWRMMSEAAAAGTAVLVSTTYLDEAERASTVLVLDRGRALYRGAPEAVAGAVVGTVVVADRRAAAGTSWRRGARFHRLAAPREVLGVGETPVVPDLEDAVIALMVEREAAQGSGASGEAGTAEDARVRVTDRPASDPATAAGSDAPAAGPAAARPVIDVRSVVTRYGDVRAVDGVSLQVRPGQVVGLLGANGAGKTTLIRTILGLEAPSAGTVQVFGGASARTARDRLGYVPQGLGLSGDLSVQQNAEFVAAVYGLSTVPPLPAGLAAERSRPVRSLALGMQRRLAFALALAHHPELLVLDEPTSGVGPLARADLWDTIHTEAERGAAVLVTTHYMQEAEQCDELLLMSHGREVGAGRLADLLGRASAVEVRTGAWQEAFTALAAAGFAVTVAGRAVRVAGAVGAEVGAALARAGVRAEVVTVPATLDEVMLLTES